MLSLKYFQNGEALAVFSYLVKFSRIAQSSTSRQHIKTVGCTFTRDSDGHFKT